MTDALDAMVHNTVANIRRDLGLAVPHIQIELVCEDQGDASRLMRLYLHWKDELEVGFALALESRDLKWGPKVRIDRDSKGYRVFVGGRAMKVVPPMPATLNTYDDVQWIGLVVPLADLFSLLNSAKFREWFDADSGEKRLYGWFNSGHQFDIKNAAADVRLFEKHCKVTYSPCCK